MNILMVHPHDLWYDPWTVRILELARGLKRRGHEVTLCHMPRKEPPRHAPLRQPSENDPPIHNLHPRQHQVWQNFRLLHQLLKTADGAHLQKCFPAAALPLLWAVRLEKKPLHYDWDDNETAIAQRVEKRFWSRYQLAVYERNLPFFADTLTYSSRTIGERAEALGFSHRRMRHLPVGADPQRFHPDKDSAAIIERRRLRADQLKVLYIGQLEGAAYAEQLIAAAPRVLAHQPETQFIFAGGGEQLDELMRRAQRSQASHAIKILGYIPAEEIPELVAAADICVACFADDEISRAKSPLKIAEYLAAGKPIVASRVGEAPWMVDGCGLCVTPNDSPALAEAILQYALNDDRRRRDGYLARQRALKHFTWEHGVDGLETMYRLSLGR